MAAFALVLASISFICSVGALISYLKALDLAQNAHHRCDTLSANIRTLFDDRRFWSDLSERYKVATNKAVQEHDHILTAHDKILQDIQSELTEFKNDVVLTTLERKTRP